MKAIKENKALQFVIIMSVLFVLAFWFVPDEKENKNNLSTVDFVPSIIFDGFSHGTKIEIVTQSHSDLKNSYIEIAEGKNSIASYDMGKNITYHINNDSRYTDLSFIQDENSQTSRITISNSPKDGKIALEIDNEIVISATPVDWAGNLEISNPILGNKNFCILLITEVTQRICHHYYPQVMS